MLFSATEARRFEAYLNSPYFNTSKKLQQLYSLLSPALANAKAIPNKQKLYARLYKGSAYNDAMMRELMSDLLKTARQFVVHEQIIADKPEAAAQRFKWAETKSDNKLRLLENEALGKLLNEYTVRDENYYRYAWLYERNKFGLDLSQALGVEHKLLERNPAAAIDALNRYYLISFTDVSMALLSLLRIYNQAPDEELMAMAEQMSHRYVNGDEHSLSMYWASYMLVKTNNEDLFKELRKQFFARPPEVLREAKLNAAVMLENFCTERIRLGEYHYAETLIEIYREEIEQGVAIEHGLLSYTFYQNVARIGADTRHLDWVEYFIEKYKIYLPDQYREKTYQYAKAHVLFAQGLYPEALQAALAAYNRYFLVMKFFIKCLLCRIYYQLGMYEQISMEMRGFKLMLDDPKILDARRMAFEFFCQCMKELVDLKTKPSKKRLAELHHQLNAAKNLMHRDWFLQKVEDLKQEMI